MKHFCIYEMSHPNKHSELSQYRFVDDVNKD